MSELATQFRSLPAAYQGVIQLAQDQHQISVTPLQELVGGFSGAAVYLVSVAFNDSRRVEHLILKVDRKKKRSHSDEIVRHNLARGKSPPEFARQHIPEINFERVENEEAIAIFYAIAGQSLHSYRPLSGYQRQNQIETIFNETYQHFLSGWNADSTFKQALPPQSLLDNWLGFRLNEGGNIESFIRDSCRVDPGSSGFLIRGKVFPNPLLYARSQEAWGATRPIDALFGLYHGDLNINNIIVSFSKDGDQLEGYYLIDFAMFKEEMPMIYDLRYLEISFLIQAMSQGSFSAGIDLMTLMGEREVLEPHLVPTEMAGASGVIRAGRMAFNQWVGREHPTLSDDLWGQYWLAGMAAGLSYCHKAGQPDQQRLAGLIYAAANLKQYTALFGLPMPAEARQLYDEGIYAAPKASQTGSGSPRGEVPNNLPVPQTKFIGRETLLAGVMDILHDPDTHLITLTGPGGTGKTRLGLKVSRAAMGQFPDGVYFIDLAPILDPALVATTTAHVLGIREGGGRPPLEKLKDYLADKQMLLFFDNFEQIVDAAPAVGELLSAAPGLKILVTSRIPLQLRGEHEVPVSPLTLPPKDLPLEKLREYEAIALFSQQAENVQPKFEINDDNRDAIAEICRRLDGLPLAIEIAAARIKMLPPKALLKRLDQGLNLLVGSARDLPDRQQTLRSTIEWSYNLLEPEEQTLFTYLGIFAGGLTLESAEGVCQAMGEIDVFTGIETLLNNSLLRQVTSVGDEPRFDMLQTIRDYALEKAEESGILPELRWAHCGYFAQVAAESEVFGAQSLMWLKRIEEEADNFRAALTWALQHPEEGVMAVITIMSPLTWYWFRYGYLQEGSDWTERTLQATEAFGDSPARAMALFGRSFLALWSGDLNRAVSLSGDAVEICVRIKFDEGLSMAKLSHGVALINQGKDKEAYPHLVDAVELFDQLDDSWNKGTAIVHLANVFLGLGNPEEAIKWLDMALPIMEKTGDIWNLAFAYNNYGEVARALGDYDKAEGFYRQTEELFTQADARGDQARLVHTFGYLAMHKGNYEEAQALFQQSLEDFRKLGNHRGMAECLAGLAGLAAEQGKHAWAAPLMAAAESQLRAFGGDWWPADRVEVERALERMRTALGEQFDVLWKKGKAMKIEEAIAYAASG